MEKSQPQGSDDYGYDLVHDDVRAGRVPGATVSREHPGPSPRKADPVPSEDYGYDEAHDF